jgi:hypothetical protein
MTRYMSSPLFYAAAPACGASETGVGLAEPATAAQTVRQVEGARTVIDLFDTQAARTFPIR